MFTKNDIVAAKNAFEFKNETFRKGQVIKMKEEYLHPDFTENVQVINFLY